VGDTILKLEIGPITLDVDALMCWLLVKSKNDLMASVAFRFLQLFKDHGVAISQIPRLIPQLTLEHLRSIESLLPVLSCDVVESAATHFGARRAWLEGVDDRIYPPSTCYSDPQGFFNDVARLNMPANGFAVRALTSSKSLNCKNDREQPVALVLVEKIKDFGSEEIVRYRPYGDSWDWSHQASRIQLKAMARVICQIYQKPVPLHQINQKDLRAIIDGKHVPHVALQGCLLTNPSLEDFALSNEESAVSREATELHKVVDYIRQHDLETVARVAGQGHRQIS
jgi:hypothetical protein